MVDDGDRIYIAIDLLEIFLIKHLQDFWPDLSFVNQFCNKVGQ